MKKVIITSLAIMLMTTTSFANDQLINNALQSIERASNKLNRILNVVEKAQNELNNARNELFDSLDGNFKEWTCSYTWRWDGPNPGDTGPYELTGKGSTKAEAKDDLIENCIKSKLNLATSLTCPAWTKKNTFCRQK